jgi:hypothetical protein
MILDKLRKMSLVELGAINGLLLGSLFELVLRSIYLLEEYSQEWAPLPPDVHIQMASYPFAWWYLPFLSLVLVTLASFCVRRYWTRRVISSVFLWQVIGALAVLGLFAYVVTVVWYKWYFSQPDLLATEYLAHVLRSELIPIVCAIPFVLGFNLFFALALRSLKPQLP